jgi:hypothetical protein
VNVERRCRNGWIGEGQGDSVGTGRKETDRVNEVAPGGSGGRTDVARYTAGTRRCRIEAHEESVGRQVVYRRGAGTRREIE